MRVAVELPVELTPIGDDGPGAPVAALLVDLSAEGGLVRSPEPLAVGETVTVHLAVPARGFELTADARVMRALDVPPAYGIRFEGLSLADHAALVRLVLAEQHARRLAAEPAPSSFHSPDRLARRRSDAAPAQARSVFTPGLHG